MAAADEVAYGYVSLFSGGGFGDIGIAYGCAIPLIACCELLPERTEILRRLFPSSSVHAGDIWDVGPDVIHETRRRIGSDRRPWLLVMSPPCQGMSSNGKGRIGVGVERGTRPEVDPRNRLLLPALDIVDALQPEWVVIENVKHMRHTSIPNEHADREALLDLLRRRLDTYRVDARVLDAADYGVPQRRERLITICSRRRVDALYHSPPSHGVHAARPHVTLSEATRHLSPLDARQCATDPSDSLHCVPKWTSAQYFCMMHTPEGATAFDNAVCVECDTEQADAAAVDCERCGKPLPRPTVSKTVWQCATCGAKVAQRRARCANGHPRTADAVQTTERRLVRAFRTSYRRMPGNRPASTLTTNSGVISSDVKGHPFENRVLSVREVLIVASLAGYPAFHPPWSAAEAVIASLPHRLVRTVAGESIPPRLLHAVVGHLAALDRATLARARVA